MYILTQSEPLENCKDNVYRVQDPDLEARWIDAGYKRYQRSYKVKDRHKEYTVICPEYRSRNKDAEAIVIVPELLIPGRPYPVYVYLYAIDLYSSAPDKGQRWAAAETRKRFGLATFDHTTLGRALKAFVRGTGKDCAITPTDGRPETNSGGPKKAGFPTKGATADLRRQAALFLRGLSVRAELQQAVPAYLKFSRNWFKKYRRFLL
jgi:hypothetical protein